MKQSIKKILFFRIFLLNLFSVCYAVGGLEVDFNVIITNNPTRFARLIPYKDIQPLAKGYIDVTKGPYFAKGDSITDDTQAIQDAINDAYDGNFVVFFPGDKVYLVSKQLRCVRTFTTSNYSSRKFGCQLVGSTKGKKPVLKLKDSSTVTGNVLMFFDTEYSILNTTTGVTTTTSDDSRHYCAGFRGIDINMGTNLNVSGITMSGAQYCSIEDVNIYGKSFYAGIKNLPGSGGYTVNVWVDGGTYGIYQSSYRPNPSINGLTLTNQTTAGIFLGTTRGPLVVTGFKITSPTSPSANYNAVYANYTASIASNVQGSLCLADGSIEMLGATSNSAIYNRDQSVTLTNVYVKSNTIITSGTTNKIMTGSATVWKRIPNYAFTSQSDAGTVYTDFIKINNQTDDFVMCDVLENATVQLPDLMSKHVWNSMPSWEDTNLVYITTYGATPENINATDDDLDKIQAAIDDVTNPEHANYGKTVFIPRGHFHISGPLNFKSGLKIIGAGKSISAIQGLSDRVYGTTPMIQTADDANGSLVMSDFAIVVYPYITLLNIRTNNTIFRNVLTEIVAAEKLKYNATYLNKPSVPFFLFSGNAGGNFFGICTGQLNVPTYVEPPIGGRYPTYHMIDVNSTINSISFNQLSMEHHGNSPQVLFSKAKNVSIYGFKYEGSHELLCVENSDSVQIIGGSGNYDLFRKDDRALVVIKNSKNVSFQNLCRKNSGSADLTKFWIKSEKDSVLGNYGVLSYKIGNIALTALNKPNAENNEFNLKVYTNEKTNELIIDGLTVREMIEIYNAQGQKVLALRNIEEKITRVNINKFIPGVYIVKVNYEAVKFLKKT
jgi:hypothetical protein